MDADNEKPSDPPPMPDEVFDRLVESAKTVHKLKLQKELWEATAKAMTRPPETPPTDETSHEGQSDGQGE